MFLIACVIYNTKLSGIASMDAFLAFCGRHADVRLLVIDNSDAQHTQNQDVLADSIIYVRNPSNLGLSRSYNRVIDMSEASDWIFWSDDDTVFSEDYLENVYRRAQDGASPLIAGVVRTQEDSVMSPFFRGIWPRPFAPAEGSIIQGAVCINSGLCVRRALYDTVGKYSEAQFMDMLDYWLFDELQKRELDRVLIVPGTVRQRFSSLEETDRQRALNRYRIFKKDFLAYCRAENKSPVYQSLILMKRRLNIFLRTGRTAT